MKVFKKDIRNLFLLFFFTSVGVSVQAVGIEGTVDKKSQDSVLLRQNKLLALKNNWKKIYTNGSYLTFDQALMGRETGVHTSRNGVVGNTGGIMIRGLNTINLDASPYVVVDGVPIKMSRGISPFVDGYSPALTGFINPLDIKQVNVLKGGFNTILYGGKGSNGIIDIEMDKGEFGAAKIEMMARVGLQKANYGVDVLSASDFRAYLFDYMHNMGQSLVDLENKVLFDSKHPKYNHNTDWMKQLQKDGFFQDYQVKLSGGDGDTRYMFGVGYTSQDETIESYYNRLNMRINLDYRITPKVSIANYLSYSYMTMRFFGQGVDWDVNPMFVAATKSPYFSKYEYDLTGVQTLRLADEDELGKSNPVTFKDNLKNHGTENRIDGMIKAKWQMIPKMALNTAFSVSYNNAIEEMRRLSYGIVNDQYRERQNSKRTYSDFVLRWDSWLERSGIIGAQITYQAKGGFVFENNTEKSVYGRRVNASTDDFESLGFGDVDAASNMNYIHKLLNFYLQGNFRMLDRISLGASINLEGSSNFGNTGRWTPYGGVELGVDVLKAEQNQLGIVAQWSRTGNNDIRGSYQSTLYYPVHYFSYGGVYLGNIKNADIKPEITNNYEAGVKTRLFNDILDVYAGYYYRKTTGLLTKKSVSMEIGLDPQFENNGDVNNQGIELALKANVMNGNHFNWSVFANVSTLKNEVTNLKNGDVTREYDKFVGVAREGEALGSFYGYNVEGVFNTTAEVNLKRTDGTPYLAGDYRMQDLNTDGVINVLDMQIIGSPLPKFYGGFGTNLSYKGIGLAVIFSYSYGNDVYNLFKQKLSSMSDFSNQSVQIKDRWISEEIPGKGDLPRAAWGDPSGNFSSSNKWVEDGSYLKLRNLSLNYDIPMQRTGFFKGVNVFLNCNNLWTITGYSGADPEVFSSMNPLLRGVDTGASPNPQSYVLGVKISL